MYSTWQKGGSPYTYTTLYTLERWVILGGSAKEWTLSLPFSPLSSSLFSLHSYPSLSLTLPPHSPLHSHPLLFTASPSPSTSHSFSMKGGDLLWRVRKFIKKKSTCNGGHWLDSIRVSCWGITWSQTIVTISLIPRSLQGKFTGLG